MAQNIVRGFTMISVASTKHGVNDLRCSLCPYVTLNLVGQGMVETGQNISCFVGLTFTLQIISITLSTQAHRELVEVTLLIFPFMLIPGVMVQIVQHSGSVSASIKALRTCYELRLLKKQTCSHTITEALFCLYFFKSFFMGTGCMSTADHQLCIRVILHDGQGRRRVQRMATFISSF